MFSDILRRYLYWTFLGWLIGLIGRLGMLGFNGWTGKITRTASNKRRCVHGLVRSGSCVAVDRWCWGVGRVSEWW